MTPDTTLGDQIPPALAAYWQALHAGRFEAAADCFSTDTVYAVAPGVASEIDPLMVTVGSDALRRRFEERRPQPWRHVPSLCVAEGRHALVEGELHDLERRPVATYVCSARFAGDGSVDRYLAFACRGARGPIPVDVDGATEPADAATVVAEYFGALDEGRFADAAAQFSDDVVYSHPPYRHTGITDPDRIEFHGRQALHQAFVTRGPARFGHAVLVSVQRGPHCLFEGAVHDLPDDGTGSFISSLSLAAGGTIRRYVSFYCEPGIPLS